MTHYPAEETIDVLAEIRDQIKEHNLNLERLSDHATLGEEALTRIERHLKSIADSRIERHLKSIADSLPIPFVPVVPDEPKCLECLTKLDEALGLVRLILDMGGLGLPGSPNAARLFEVEAILSRKLGNPIWEGGPK